MNRSSVTIGEALAAACGVLLLLAMIALPWFSATVEPMATDVGAGATNIAGAFNAYTGIDYVLLACIILLVVVPLLGGGRAGAGVVTVAALLALGLIVYTIIAPPGNVPPAGFTVIITAQIGVYVGAAFAALALIGGIVAIGQSGAAAQAPTATHDAV